MKKNKLFWLWTIITIICIIFIFYKYNLIDAKDINLFEINCRCPKNYVPVSSNTGGIPINCISFTKIEDTNETISIEIIDSFCE